MASADSGSLTAEGSHEMPLYESVFIVRQDVTATQVDSLADGFAKVIEENGGSIDRREYWGLRNLAYRIKKNRKGHYVLFNLKSGVLASAT